MACSKNDDVDDTIITSITTPLFTCVVCAEDKPITQYVHFNSGSQETSTPIPSECQSHLIPGQDGDGGVCIVCIKSHILSQLSDDGSAHITCIFQHDDMAVDFNNTRWRRLAKGFLPESLHEKYDQRVFQEWLKHEIKWMCPDDCETTGMTLVPRVTPGYPHVVCIACQGRFCARCHVHWHEGMTCSQYAVEHSEVLTEEKRAVLKEMAALGARICPNCSCVTIKEGGCAYMSCKECGHGYMWDTAEKVRTPPPNDSDTREDAQAEYDLRFEQLALEESDDPERGAPVRRDGVVQEEGFPQQECEIDAIRASQSQSH